MPKKTKYEEKLKVETIDPAKEPKKAGAVDPAKEPKKTESAVDFKKRVDALLKNQANLLAELSPQVVKNTERIANLEVRVKKLEEGDLKRDLDDSLKTKDPEEPEKDSTSKEPPKEEEKVKASEEAKKLDSPRKGPGYAFRYWDPIGRTYGLTSNIWKAKQISNGVYDIIWVWYEADEIDHILTKEELIKYAP